MKLYYVQPNRIEYQVKAGELLHPSVDELRKAVASFKKSDTIEVFDILEQAQAYAKEGVASDEVYPIYEVELSDRKVGALLISQNQRTVTLTSEEELDVYSILAKDVTFTAVNWAHVDPALQATELKRKSQRLSAQSSANNSDAEIESASADATPAPDKKRKPRKSKVSQAPAAALGAIAESYASSEEETPVAVVVEASNGYSAEVTADNERVADFADEVLADHEGAASTTDSDDRTEEADVDQQTFVTARHDTQDSGSSDNNASNESDDYQDEEDEKTAQVAEFIDLKARDTEANDNATLKVVEVVPLDVAALLGESVGDNKDKRNSVQMALERLKASISADAPHADAAKLNPSYTIQIDPEEDIAGPSISTAPEYVSLQDATEEAAAELSTSYAQVATSATEIDPAELIGGPSIPRGPAAYVSPQDAAVINAILAADAVADSADRATHDAPTLRSPKSYWRNVLTVVAPMVATLGVGFVFLGKGYAADLLKELGYETFTLAAEYAVAFGGAATLAVAGFAVGHALSLAVSFVSNMMHPTKVNKGKGPAIKNTEEPDLAANNQDLYDYDPVGRPSAQIISLSEHRKAAQPSLKEMAAPLATSPAVEATTDTNLAEREKVAP